MAVTPTSVLVVVNSPGSGPGNLLTGLAASGVITTVVAEDDIPSSPDGFDGIILLGGGFLPDDDERAPWLARERLLATRCIERGIPLLGICLGAQLLAAVAGGKVHGSFGEPERGVVNVAKRSEAADDALLGSLDDEFFVLQNHRDQITQLPPGATHLASNAACNIQAFRVGSTAWGVQFHPEAPVSRLDAWDETALRREGLELAALRQRAIKAQPSLDASSQRIIENFAGVVMSFAEKRSIRVVDGHNDLMWEMRERDIAPERFVSGIEGLHTDLRRMREGYMGAQFWSVWVPDGTPHPFDVASQQIARVHELVERAPHDLEYTPLGSQVRSAIKRGMIGCLIGAEGTNCLEGQLSNVEALARLGVRYMTLTHNDSTMWADSATGENLHGGLSAKGVKLVAELERTGVLVDLSHVSAATMSTALDVASVPVIFSHSSNFALTRHPRNVPDAILRRLAANDGVQMLTFVPQFVSEAYRLSRASERSAQQRSSTAYLADVADHVEHSCDVAGIAHIGLGGDFDGISVTPEGLDDVSTYPALLNELRRRGWTAGELSALASDNVMRVLEATDEAYQANLR